MIFIQNSLFKNILSHSASPAAKQNWIYVTSVSHYRHTADDIPFYRDHALGYQMFYSVSGQGWLDYEGIYQKISPGTITCIDLGKRHGIGAVKGSIWEHYWILCHGKAFEDIYTLVFNKNNVHKLQNPSQFANSFKELYFSKQNHSVYFDIDAMSVILQVCSTLMNQDPSFVRKKDPFSIMLKQTIEYIDNNYFKELDVAVLAENAGYSRFHFSRLFKAHTGFSPRGYITKVRIEKAKDMLTRSNFPLQIIAEKAGFGTVNYLIRVFKEQENITPGKYRRLQSF